MLSFTERHLEMLHTWDNYEAYPLSSPMCIFLKRNDNTITCLLFYFLLFIFSFSSISSSLFTKTIFAKSKCSRVYLTGDIPQGWVFWVGGGGPGGGGGVGVVGGG